MDAARLRTARMGVVLFFLTNGMTWSNLVPRYPEIAERLGLEYTQFGAAVAAGPIGALVLGLAAGALCRRFTSATIAAATTILMLCAAVGVSFAPTWLALAAGLFFMGAFDSITDVAQNAHGLRVQRAYGRSLLNGFHALWSVGSVIGGLIGSGAAALHIPLPLHLGIMAVVIGSLTIVARRMALPGPDADEEVAHEDTGNGFRSVPARAWLLLIAFSLIALAGASVEDAGSTWSAMYMRDVLDAAPGVTGMAFVGLMALHFIGRITGDRLIDRFSGRLVVGAGGLLTLVAMGIALLFPSIPGTIIGFALAGLGVATSVPVAMHAADEIDGFRATTALTLSSWALRLGWLAGPPLVGFVADTWGLRIGLIAVPLAGLTLLALARTLPQEHGKTPAAA